MPQRSFKIKARHVVPARRNQRRQRRGGPRSPEVKNYITAINSQAYFDNSTGQYTFDATAIPQGVGGGSRVGDIATVASMHMTYVIANGLGATSNPAVVSRIFCYQYLGDSSVANKPTIADFLVSTVANGGTTYGTFSPIDIDYKHQYVMLYDSGPILTIGTNGLAAVATAEKDNYHTKSIRINLKRADKNIEYYGGGTTGPNHIFFTFTSNGATVATNPTATFFLETRFTDS